MALNALREDAAVPAGDVSVAALAWRHSGVTRVTALAKATFAFVPDGVMTRVSPQPVVGGEVTYGGSPARSVRLTSDLAPYLNRADVLLTGHAHAPPGVGVETLPVRLGVFAGAHPILDKTVLVRQKGGVKRVALVYEGAYGGPGWPDNPFGVGILAGGADPSLIDPFDDKKLAGFGPIGQAWPARRRLLGSLPRLVLSTSHVLDLPDAFDWEYLQAAPLDQRIGFLHGDEWIVMDGFHPTHARLRTRLPGARGLALVYGLSPWGVLEGQPIALHGDTLRIDVDEERCTLTCRGTFPVADDHALGAVRVALGVELPGEPIPWPDPTQLIAHGFSMEASTSAPESSVIPLSDEDFESVRGDVLMGTLLLEYAAEPREVGPSPAGGGLTEHDGGRPPIPAGPVLRVPAAGGPGAPHPLAATVASPGIEETLPSQGSNEDRKR
jgi:hypothetical protein